MSEKKEISKRSQLKQSFNFKRELEKKKIKWDQLDGKPYTSNIYYLSFQPTCYIYK